MKKITILLMASAILLSSCASILNGKYQKVAIKTKNPKSVVYVNGEKQGQGKQVVAKMVRNQGVKQVKIETEGYKDQYAIHYQTSKSPLYIMSWIPFGITVYVPLLDMGPKSFNYPKELAVKEELVPIATKQETQKFIFVKNTEFKLGANDLKIRKIKHSSLKKNKTKKFKDIDSNDEDIKFDNSIFTNSLNDILIKYKYTDSTNTIFRNTNNSAYISATITKLDIQQVYQQAARSNMRFYKTEVQIEWDFLDVFGQSVYKETSKDISGEFSPNFNKENTVLLAIEDAITKSFLKFISNKNVVKSLDIGVVAERTKLETIKLQKSKPVTNLSDATNAAVTIKVKEGHGSGFPVSADGYILTNFHVISTSKDDITVVTKDKRELKGKVIRQDEILDIALIKVEGDFENYFELPKQKNYSVGDDIFIVGTPKTIELGNTLTKGIISGEREDKNYKLIQTDASINGGNSGGPLINREGKLHGVVNAKMSGFGVEGIGFAIPAELISGALFIE